MSEFFHDLGVLASWAAIIAVGMRVGWWVLVLVMA